MQTLGIIPARYQSTRFPGKPLVEIDGKIMIQRVYEQASKVKGLDQIIVATDDTRIVKAVEGFGGVVELTDAGHATGTDRVAEVAERHEQANFIVNIQGDEPFIDPLQIEQIIALLQKEKAQIATLIKQISDPAMITNPDVVKVVCDSQQNALYFSRAAIPFNRDNHQQNNYFKHIGLYGFSRRALLEITALPAGHLEQIEKLEQLRWLEAGWKIKVAETDRESRGIDRPEDLGTSRVVNPNL